MSLVVFSNFNDSVIPTCSSGADGTEEQKAVGKKINKINNFGQPCRKKKKVKPKAVLENGPSIWENVLIFGWSELTERFV